MVEVVLEALLDTALMALPVPVNKAPIADVPVPVSLTSNPIPELPLPVALIVTEPATCPNLHLVCNP